MMGKGPVQRLVIHKDYVVEMVTSIIKETNLNVCGEHTSEDLGAFGLYNLSRVRIHRFFLFLIHFSSIYSNRHSFTLGDGADEGPLGQCVANEGVIQQFRKRQEIENKEKDQYKEVVWTLNMELVVKLALLEKETHRQEELEKMITNLTTELATLREQMEKAKTDVMATFYTS